MYAYGFWRPAGRFFKRTRLAAIVFVVTLSAPAVMPIPAYAAGKIAFGPNNLTIAEGQSDQITVLLDDQSAAQAGSVDLSLAMSDSSRVSIAPASIHFDLDGSNVAPPKYFTITVIDDDTHNSSNIITISSTATSDVDYYNGHSVSLTLTIQDNDAAPATTTQQQVAAATTQATTPTTPPADKKILLDDFDDFTTGVGERLNLTVGQVVYFTLYGQEHSITVKEIGDTYAVVTVASEPVDINLGYGKTVKHDVDGDGQNDLLLTSYHLDGQSVTIDFQRSVGTSTPQTLAATTVQPIKSQDPPATFRNNPVLIAIGCLVIVGAGGLLLWLIRKQRKSGRIYKRIL